MADLKLPICQGTYSTDSTNSFKEVEFINGVMQAVEAQTQEYRPFFVGICYNSWLPRYKPGFECDMQRCSGCQLVSYCNRECQKADWYRHKYVCKEFPVVKGKNVLYTKVSWKKHIAGIRERATRIPHAKPIFRNPRVCRTCKEARQERLADCKCMCVSYCSKKCSKADKQHTPDCGDLLQIVQFYSFHRIPTLLPPLRFITDYSWKDVQLERCIASSIYLSFS